MTPYVESGRAAQRKLERAQPLPQAERQRLLSNLRGLKQVINTFGVAAILLVPTIGFIAQSARLAALSAVLFLCVICVLEVIERGVKRRLADAENSA